MSTRKDIKQILKRYKLYSIIGWITLIPTVVSFAVQFGIEFESSLIENVLLAIGSVSGILLFISLVGKIFYWIKLFSHTTSLTINSKDKNKLILYLILSIFIPFVFMFLYKRKIKK